MKNKGLKVGDRIKEGDRYGRIVAFHTKGTVDVIFDGEDYPIRRQLPNVSRATRQNPDFERIQYQAQVQGIYESQVKEFLGLPYKTPFEDRRGKRLDEQLTKKERRDILSGAFAIATSVGRKYGYLQPSPDRSEPYPIKPTRKGIKRIFERISEPEELIEDQEDYEQTLSLARKNPMQLRKNVESPIGVTFTEMKKLISTEIGFYELDTYIRWENVPRSKKIPQGFIDPQLMPALYLTARISNTKRDGSGQMRMNPRPLFGSSSKTNKSDGSPVEVRVIYLQPSKQSDKPMPKKGKRSYDPQFADLCECVGIYPPIQFRTKTNPQTCPFAGECGKICLVGSGQLGKEDAEFSGWCKTWLWFHYPVVFLRQLLKEIKKEAARSKRYGMEFFARLNGTSDITWERFIDMDALVRDLNGFGGFYDYTKYPYKARKKAGKWVNGKAPTHYDITYSISEKEEVTGQDGLKDAIDWLVNGGRVAVVVDQWKRYPFDRTPRGKQIGSKGENIVYEKKNDGSIVTSKYAITDYSDLRDGAINAPDWSPTAQPSAYPLVVDGDETDFRFNDPPHSIIVLKPKGLSTKSDGKYYVDGNIYTGYKPKEIKGKARAFIKSKDFVLGLQDHILDLLGYNTQSIAKNPRHPSPVRVIRNDGYYSIVKDGELIHIRGETEWSTLSSLKRAVMGLGFRVMRKGANYYILPRS